MFTESSKSPAAFLCTPVMEMHEGELVPAMQDAHRDSPALGVFLLLEKLRQADCDCDIIDWVASDLTHVDDIVKRVRGYRVLFISANSMNFGTAYILGQKVKRAMPDIHLCLGGPHPTKYPGHVRKSNVFDSLFRGEADRWIVSIYDAILRGNRKRIPGFTMLKDDISTVAEPYFEDQLSEVNWKPAYDLIEDGKYLSLPVETSRGCKYCCAFCSIPSKSNWRGYPAKTAIQQLEYVHEFREKTPYGRINIVDDTFTTDAQRVYDICSNLSKNEFAHRLMYDATLLCLRNENLVETLSPFTSDLLVGAEVASSEEAKRITKASRPSLIENAARNLRKQGIADRAVFSFIIGFPWQSRDDCISTVEYICDLILEYGVRVYLQWYWPMPGSKIWDDLVADGKVDITCVETPGFFKSEEWFYKVRKIGPSDVEAIDDRIQPLKLLLNVQRMGNARSALDYAAPRLDVGEWITRKNPFISEVST